MAAPSAAASAADATPGSAQANGAPAPAAPALAATAQRPLPRPPSTAELDAQLDAILRRGEDRPEAALAQIDALAAQQSIGEPGTQPQALALRRALTLARAELAARGLDAARANQQRTAAVGAARAIDGALAAADDSYLLALRADRDESAAAPEATRSALLAYETYCRSPAVIGAASAAAGATAPIASGCEFRRRWRLHQLQATQARRQHAWTAAHGSARAAQALAQANGDGWRQAWSETEQAMVSTYERDVARAQLHLQRAQQLANRFDDVVLGTRLLFTEAAIAGEQGDAASATRLLLQALAQAREAQSPRLQALALNNLSDRALYSGRAAEALDAALQGLATVAPLQLPHLERVLRNNAMLARVALGRQAEARQDFEALQAAWAADGATGLQLSSLREYGDALAAAGELKVALEMYHRERALSQQLMAANRDAALAELRTRYDREAQQRDILQLERDNALKSAKLDNQGLLRKLWALGGGVLALAVVLLLLLVRRVHATNRLLKRSRARLRVQSQRDALTGLVNRRHAQAVLHGMARAAEGAGPPAFVGALLMIDIDHFKRINDEHGHAAGDGVLVEVARRIASAVRGKDTVARWGGEEFLVLAPGLHQHDTNALARRVLQAVAGAPVRLPTGAPLRVSASIGHAVFPLPPNEVSLSPEQALNLVDMALYTAKSQGRNRAVGIVQADATDAEALRKLESDFERAWREGRVILRIDPGP